MRDNISGTDYEVIIRTWKIRRWKIYLRYRWMYISPRFNLPLFRSSSWSKRYDTKRPLIKKNESTETDALMILSIGQVIASYTFVANNLSKLQTNSSLGRPSYLCNHFRIAEIGRRTLQPGVAHDDPASWQKSDSVQTRQIICCPRFQR